MKISILLTALVGFSFIATAQVSDADYQRKLDEFKRKAATRPAATSPSGGDAAGGAEARVGAAGGAGAARGAGGAAGAGVRAGGWTLKADAPDDVKAWFRDFGKLKATAFAEATREMNDGHVGLPAAPWEIRVSRADKQRALAAAKGDPHFIPWPNPTDFEIGKITTLPAMQLRQVMGDEDCLVGDGTHVYWVTKFRTAGYTDGQAMEQLAVRITGTKRYQTADGASKTDRLLEVVLLEEYLAEWPAGYNGPRAPAGWPGYCPVKSRFKAANDPKAAPPAK